MTFETRSFSGFEEIINPPPFRDAEVVGLEDVRLVGDMFTATQKQWTPEGSDNLMAVGHFPTMQFTVASSRTNARRTGSCCRMDGCSTPGDPSSSESSTDPS
jgi:hypothetical protein